MTSPPTIRALFLGKHATVLASLQAANSSPWATLDVSHSSSLSEYCFSTVGTAWDLLLVHLEQLRQPLQEDLAALHSAFPEVPVVVLSTDEDDVLGLEALEAGADEYFSLAGISSLAITRTLAQTVRRSRVETRLRSRERQLATAQQLACLGSWEWDLATNEISCSAELSRICDGEPRTFLLQYESWAERALPEVMGHSLTSAEDLAPFTAEQEFTRRDGSSRTVLTRAEIIFNQNGRAERLIGICQDVSAQRCSEKERAELVAALGAQRRSLEEMVRNVPGIVWEWHLPSPSQRPTFVSDHAAAMLGYPMERWAEDPNFGMTITEPEDLPGVMEQMERALTSGEPHVSRYRLIAADGCRVPVEVHSAVIRNEQGQVVGTRGVTMDVSDRHAAAEALAHSEQTLRTIVENSREIIYRFSLEDGVLDYVSPAVQSIGYSPDELLRGGSGVAGSLAHPEDLAHIEDTFQRLLVGDGSQNDVVEYRVLTKGGSIRWVSDSRVLLRDSAGEPVAVVGNLRDITEQKCAEAALETATRQLVETSRRAGMAEVASNVLHNVGNVLNSVNVSVEFLRRTLLDAKAPNLSRLNTLLAEHASDLPRFLSEHPQGRELPGYLRGLTTYLENERAQMLQDLSALTGNLEHIKGVIAMQQSHSRVGSLAESVLPSDVVEDALRINSCALECGPVDIVRDYQPVPRLDVERHVLLQVLVNLISNASYAIAEAAVDGRLVVRIAAQDAASVVITVCDNGLGIPAENMSRIFEHGFTTRTAGHGYGLHSAALAASDLGGSLHAFSNGPGTGATFTLVIPTAPPTGPSRTGF